MKEIILSAAVALALGVSAQAADSNEMHVDTNTTIRAGTNTTQDADNTGRNVRDRNHQSLTPLDQGNSREDLQITKQIRQEILSKKNLSVNAHNVKVITNNGRIVLRGPVKTEEEKQTIGEIATRASQGGRVENELEVQAAESSR